MNPDTIAAAPTHALKRGTSPISSLIPFLPLIFFGLGLILVASFLSMEAKRISHDDGQDNTPVLVAGYASLFIGSMIGAFTLAVARRYHWVPRAVAVLGTALCVTLLILLHS